MLNPDFSAADFLLHYWQKKPVVIPQGLVDFNDFVDEHDLAGLAMEEDVDSRIVSHGPAGWQVAQGPFEDFDEVCQDQWSLLVQGVDRYIPEASDLMRAFSFIPHWRMDDLMISFAVPGAGVGPHVDQYDVFLIQGKGQRHWKVGAPENSADTCPHPKLRQVAPFTPVIDVVLSPGDILYIPPNWPHEGTAVTDCLTYSVGFRAPDQQVLGHMLADALTSQDMPSLRYSDPDLALTAQPQAITEDELNKLKQLLHSAIDSDDFTNVLLTRLSEQFLPVDDDTDSASAEEVQAMLSAGDKLQLVPGCRPLVYTTETTDSALFIEGEKFTLTQDQLVALQPLLDGHSLCQQALAQNSPDFAIFVLLSTLLNKGYLIWQ